MGLLVSAESFNPRDETTIRKQNAVKEGQAISTNKEKHINKKYLQGCDTGTCAQLRALPLSLMLRATVPPGGGAEKLTVLVPLTCVCAGKKHEARFRFCDVSYSPAQNSVFPYHHHATAANVTHTFL